MSISCLYFAYGSNMSGERLAARVPWRRALGPARLADMTLCFDKPGSDGTAKANLMPRVGAAAWGVVYEIERPHLDVLDRFEPGYARRLRSVALSSGETRSAYVYLFRGGGTGAPAPSREYLRHLLVGARAHGLPEEWIELIVRAGRVPGLPHRRE